MTVYVQFDYKRYKNRLLGFRIDRNFFIIEAGKNNNVLLRCSVEIRL